MIAWILKMLLKFLKPVAKVMIIEAILGSLEDFVVETEPETEDASAEGE